MNSLRSVTHVVRCVDHTARSQASDCATVSLGVRSPPDRSGLGEFCVRAANAVSASSSSREPLLLRTRRLLRRQCLTSSLGLPEDTLLFTAPPAKQRDVFSTSFGTLLRVSFRHLPDLRLRLRLTGKYKVSNLLFSPRFLDKFDFYIFAIANTSLTEFFDSSFSCYIRHPVTQNLKYLPDKFIACFVFSLNSQMEIFFFLLVFFLVE